MQVIVSFALLSRVPNILKLLVFLTYAKNKNVCNKNLLSQVNPMVSAYLTPEVTFST
jgi:hypothetical protein